MRTQSPHRGVVGGLSPHIWGRVGGSVPRWGVVGGEAPHPERETCAGGGREQREQERDVASADLIQTVENGEDDGQVHGAGICFSERQHAAGPNHLHGEAGAEKTRQGQKNQSLLARAAAITKNSLSFHAGGVSPPETPLMWAFCPPNVEIFRNPLYALKFFFYMP